MQLMIFYILLKSNPDERDYLLTDLTFNGYFFTK